jgi:hypothetical protein
MLEKQAHVNDLSPELRATLEKKINDWGDFVRYKFNISHPDPHPDNKGKLVWPAVFTLGPIRFQITDPYEKRPNVSKLKTVGLVKDIDPEKGHPTSYRRIQVKAPTEGWLQLDLRDPEDREKAMLLELHIKHSGGMFFDKTKGEGVFQRVDELAMAKANRSNRKTRLAAMTVVESFNEDEIRDFVSAMGNDENRPMEIMQEELAELAEKQPLVFTEQFNTGTWKWRAMLKRAFDKQLIVHHPVEDKVTFTSSQETVAVLTRSEGDTRSLNHRTADALQAQGDKGDKLYNRIAVLVKAQAVA